MIISRTPVRVSFFGGGTDYPDYYHKHGGAVINATIDKYCYISVCRLSHFFDHSIRVSYTKTELVKSVNEIQHPSVRECLRFMDVADGIEINYFSNLPARTGTGSSSSFTVGLLHSLYAFKNQMVSKKTLAEQAVYVEQQRIKERVGCQDQYASAFGGLNHITFNPDGRIELRPVVMPRQRLDRFRDCFLMFYTGITRCAHEVLEEQLSRTEQNTPQLKELASLVDQALEVLTGNGPLRHFGELLHRSWMLKKSLSTRISNGTIDGLYATARQAGAVGGKLMGAGAGGFMLLFVEQDRKQAVRDALHPLKEVKFDFENEGSRIIFYNPEEM